MGFFNIDPAILALVAGTVFFVLLGILVLLIGEIERRKVFGILFVLVGIALALFAMGGGDAATVVIAVIAALVANEVLEYLGVVS